MSITKKIRDSINTSLAKECWDSIAPNDIWNSVLSSIVDDFDKVEEKTKNIEKTNLYALGVNAGYSRWLMFKKYPLEAMKYYASTVGSNAFYTGKHVIKLAGTFFITAPMYLMTTGMVIGCFALEYGVMKPLIGLINFGKKLFLGGNVNGKINENGKIEYNYIPPESFPKVREAEEKLDDAIKKYLGSTASNKLNALEELNKRANEAFLLYKQINENEKSYLNKEDKQTKIPEIPVFKGVKTQTPQTRTSLSK